MNLSPEEIRVLGCLLEKERTTPDVYPLTLNALLVACNQSTNRNPIVHYDELTVERALASLREQGLARRGAYAGSRSPKHRHALDETWHLSIPEQAILGVLMLRGPQTVGEIKMRTERLYAFSSPDELDAALTELSSRADPLIAKQARQPGQKESRYTHTLNQVETSEEHPAEIGSRNEQLDRLTILEMEVQTLRQQFDALQAHILRENS